MQVRGLAVLSLLAAGGCEGPAPLPGTAAVTAAPAMTREDGLFPLAQPSHKVGEFTRLLDRRLELKSDPAATGKIDSEIRAKYERTLGVMITDMSGMTELTKKRGILGILALIREMQHITVPVLRARGATWVKMEADDLFVTHTRAKDLYTAAREMLEAVEKHRAAKGDDAIKMGIGLGWGNVIDLDDDLWGDAVNTASKLGEDTSQPGEILMTEDFHAALVGEGFAAPECKPVEGAAKKASFAYRSCR